MLSKLWAHAGTFLGLLVSGLGLGHVVSLGNEVQAVVLAVTGLLVGLHVIKSSQATAIEQDVGSVVTRLGEALSHSGSTTTHATTTTTTPSTTATVTQ